jgi:hypothetical protein
MERRVTAIDELRVFMNTRIDNRATEIVALEEAMN